MVKSITVNKELKQKIINKYQNYRINPPQYASDAFKKGKLNIVIYNSLKVVFSGQFDEIEISEFIDSTDYYISNIIGSDEVGTGDFFGPIFVVSAYIKESDIERLKSMGIADSKRLSDDRILEIAKVLITFIEYSVVECNNKKYNDLYDKGYHIKQILAMMHHKAIKQLNKSCKTIIDQFVEKKTFEKYLNTKVSYTFETKAESSYACVAVASIIARAYFIRAMNNLENQINELLDNNVRIIYGAGDKVDLVGKSILRQIGEEKLKDYVKYNFKNIEKIKE